MDEMAISEPPFTGTRGGAAGSSAMDNAVPPHQSFFPSGGSASPNIISSFTRILPPPSKLVLMVSERCWAGMSRGGHELSTAPGQGRAGPSFDAARSATASWSRALAMALTGAVNSLLPPRRPSAADQCCASPLSLLQHCRSFKLHELSSTDLRDTINAATEWAWKNLSDQHLLGQPLIIEDQDRLCTPGLHPPLKRPQLLVGISARVAVLQLE